MIVTASVDGSALHALRALELQVEVGQTLVLVVSLRGIQFWLGTDAAELLLDADWNRLDSVSVVTGPGDGAQDWVIGGFISDRLCVPVVHRDSTIRVQLPVFGRGSGSTSALYCDAYDLRRLSRKVNGYKTVYEREHTSGQK